MEAVADFIFLGSKITADGDRSHEIKKRLLPGSKAVANLHSISKSRAITLLTKVHIFKAMELSHIKVRKGGGEEIPLVQGKAQWLRFAGAAVKRYSTPKVRETQVRQ